MAELTTEYLDKKLEGLATKADLNGLASKVDLEQVEQRLEQKIDDQTEALARIVNAGFEEVYRRLDVWDEVQELQKQMQEVRSELKLA